MTIDPNAPAFARLNNYGAGSTGISIRAHLASLVMQGLMACSDTRGSNELIANASVSMADALIAALNKPTT